MFRLSCGMILSPVSMLNNIRSNQSGWLCLRRTLAESHVGAVTIASLLLISLSCSFYALWDPLLQSVYFIVEAIAIVDIPYFSNSFTEENFLLAMTSVGYLYMAAVCGLAAAFLSEWVYGVGAFTSLRRYRKLIVGGHRV